ncbi:hypothetical protein ACWEVD_15625 [Nocardia thailandica]
MSERPVEDEIINEARNFGRALMALASQHGRAVSWLEQRRIRKEISRALRQQRQHEYLARQQHKMWTEQAVNRYRAHSLAVTARGADPTIDHARRYRDQVALRSHAAGLQQMVLDNHHLNPVEQGIALDGIASATEFPRHRQTTSMFAGARRVKAINALRYRANVARTRKDLPHERSAITEARRQLAAQPSTTTHEERRMPNTPAGREAAVQQLRGAQLSWNINVALTNNPTVLRALNAGVETAIRQAHEAGVPAERIEWERDHAYANTRFTASVYSRRPGHKDPQVIQTVHPNRREAVEWTHRTVENTNWMPQVDLEATVAERGIDAPQFEATGTYEQVSAHTKQWTQSLDRDSADPGARMPKTTQVVEDDRLAAVEKQLKAMVEDRDRLSSKVTMLQRGFDSVKADRDEMRTKLDAAEGRIETLTNRNQRLAAEIDEVRRDQPDIDALRVERDQYKTERDQAVQKLATQTPPHERYGSRERVAAGADTQSIPNPRANGHNGIERSR